VGLQLDSRRWQWNDFVVTTDSQMFAGRRAVGSVLVRTEWTGWLG
jgi:hypothetical protein